MTGQVEKSGLKQKYLYNFKMEKYQLSFIFKFFLIYSRKGIHLKSVFNAASSATFTLIISVQQWNQPVVEILTDMHEVHLGALCCILSC